MPNSSIRPVALITLVLPQIVDKNEQRCSYPLILEQTNKSEQMVPLKSCIRVISRDSHITGLETACFTIDKRVSTFVNFWLNPNMTCCAIEDFWQINLCMFRWVYLEAV